jgi:UTP--glucose-1-phosphate uridylyltransferase
MQLFTRLYAGEMRMSRIKKAVIPAAGLGTRFLPVTKSMPKEMLPIIDKPVIHYVVEEAVASGIEDIIIITGRGKRAIEDYFDESPELEMHLLKNNKKALFEVVRDISSLVDIHYIRQKEPKGLGDAILRAEKHIGDEPFAVLLGDDIIRNKTPCILQLMEKFERYQSPIMAVEELSWEKVSNYGIINGTRVEGDMYLLDDIIEKPKIEDAPSNLGTVGRYILTPDIFDCIKKTSQGVANEIQLTDSIRILMEYKKFYAYLFQGRRYDTGDKAGYLRAIIDLAMETQDLKSSILEYMKINIDKSSGR